MFVYLVNVFNAMPGGRIIGVIFFICVLFAGVSSIVNLYEAPIAFLQEQFKFKRAAAVGTIGVHRSGRFHRNPAVDLSVDGRCFHLHLPARRCSGRHHVLLGTGQGKRHSLLSTNGAKKPIGGWFYPLGKWVYVICAVLALILGVMYGGIG